MALPARPSFLGTVRDQMRRHRVTVYAAALSYSFIFALFPLLLFVAALLAFLGAGHRIPILHGPESHLLAPGLLRLLEGAITSASRFKSPTLLSVGAIGFLGAMSSAIRQLMTAFNAVYGIETSRRGFLATFALSVGLGLILGLLVVFAELVMVAGSHVIRSITLQSGMSGVSLALSQGVSWGLFLLTLWCVLTLLYNWLPESSTRFRWFLPGTVTALLLWLIMSWGFSLYVSHFAHYDRTYGSLGGVILLLLYLYLVSLTLLIGGLVNAIHDQRVASHSPPTSL